MNHNLHAIRRATAEVMQTDGQLLEAYSDRRDGAAFAELVRRHGPMVRGVCRRKFPNRQDAEDAFQATFLVLVRKSAQELCAAEIEVLPQSLEPTRISRKHRISPCRSGGGF